MQYEVIKNIPDHADIQAEMTHKLWPEFMLHDPVSNANGINCSSFFLNTSFL